MRINHHDVEQVGSTIAQLRDAAIDALDDVFDYLDNSGDPRTDFNDRRLHVQSASRLGNVLEMFAEIQMWSAWQHILTGLIADKGEAATMEDCAAAMTKVLVTRTQGFASRPMTAGPMANLYTNFVTEQFANAVLTCNQLTAADTIVHDLLVEVAGGLGIPMVEAEGRLKDGDPVVSKAVGRLALDKANDKLRAMGIVPPPISTALAVALGMAPFMPEGAVGASSMGGRVEAADIPPELRDVFESLGLDPNRMTQLGNSGVFLASRDAEGFEGEAPPPPAAVRHEPQVANKVG